MMCSESKSISEMMINDDNLTRQDGEESGENENKPMKAIESQEHSFRHYYPKESYYEQYVFHIVDTHQKNKLEKSSNKHQDHHADKLKSINHEEGEEDDEDEKLSDCDSIECSSRSKRPLNLSASENNTLDEKIVKKKIPRTLENTRAFDETFVKTNDHEIFADEHVDELSNYYVSNITPKIFITTSLISTKIALNFVDSLSYLFPNSVFCPRRKCRLTNVVEFAKTRGFTDLIVVNEDRKKVNGMILVHLPDGPTALFKVSSIQATKNLKYKLYQYPEIILNNFDTRLGRLIGRMLGALVPHSPDFKGRRVITLHNQRDFIFVRHHLYEFNGPSEANLRELGPQFTLKLRSLQKGTFLSKTADYIYQPKSENNPHAKKVFIL